MESLLVEEPDDWNQVIRHLPGAHVLQTWQWAQVKARLGWRPLPYIWTGSSGLVVAAALLLERRIPAVGFLPRLSLLYCPKGPLMDWEDEPLRKRVLDDLQAFARRRGSIFLKIDPDVPLGVGVPGADGAEEDETGAVVTAALRRRGWRFSGEQVQFRNTVLVDVDCEDEDLLSRMKQKTRYNVRLAEKKGVAVRRGDEADFDLLYHMYAETSVRDGFVIRDQAYYQDVWHTFLQAGMADILIAEVEGQPVGAVVLLHFAGRAWYLYGMSRDLYRERMPNHLLQFEAMRAAREAGCTTYDLWGAPDTFDETDSMWGVFRFKEGLGGQVLRTLGAWDYPASPLLYRLYTQTLPRLLEVMRRRGKARVRQEVSAP